jgi:hypothetical protein
LTRQQRFQKLVDAYWRTGHTTPKNSTESLRTKAQFDLAAHELAEYVAKTSNRVTIGEPRA